ncbi:oxidoreductase, short chain dehydrogenase/reductase family protein [Aeromicrobium marinum DSM 15272]|uniref:Oxidoreductase, short chain dehydrogenase/reductase family protein n=1 Tax=Aeromicrobium marinum DSM 15272 TaxID=585531 RepID=E2SDA3_9ACTN|nr:SDR family oxidoreductase [Aeromicrobium marinum]EFQ82480.1 oxidoreductase, short chain dehydrogenase/reductase family protein [Aeromicrobium marinum DSM 15272]
MRTHPVRDKVAVITGAGSGIGRALAIELSARGARVSGCDLSEDALKETSSLCRGELHQAVVDMGERDAVREYAAEVADHFGQVHQIFNNAGIAFNSLILDSEWADYERVLRVNLHGVVHGTQAFLPHLIASGDGHVVNVSSMNGYLALPGMSHYCTSKFAVRGFTESLRTEMLLDRHPVRVSVVHPGGVATNIADSAVAHARAAGVEITPAKEARARTYREKLLTMDPQRAARIIVDGVEKGRPRIRVGQDAIVVDRIVRLLPSSATRMAVHIERRLQKSEHA